MLTKDFNSLLELFEVFSTEQKCIDYLEKLRWNGNVVSPFDCTSKVYKCKDNKYRCKNTGKYFNVKTNTLFDNTKIPLKKWFAAIWLVTCHKRGISSLQLSKDIDVTQKTAWFMLRRIRKIIKSDKQTLKINNLIMENKKLAIKGHATRGSEVIALLEMLGGINTHNLYGDESYAYYTIDCDKKIKGGIYVFGDENLSIFTLEQFEEKFPYKVMDKVNAPCKGCIKTITSMEWNTYLNTVTYILDNRIYTNIDQLKVVNDLQPYKEEIKAEDRLEIYADTSIDNDSKTDIIINGEKLIAPKGYTIGNATRNSNKLIVEYIKNKPQYPKTYQECCDVLDIYSVDNEVMGYNNISITLFQQLLICRDAYWKFEGDWKPIWNTNSQIKYLITRWNDNIIKETYFTKDCILAFPTEEMRDAFFENFKDLIEGCKEFL